MYKYAIWLCIIGVRAGGEEGLYVKSFQMIYIYILYIVPMSFKLS